MMVSSRPNTLEIKLNNRIVGTITRLVNEAIIFAFDPEYEADTKRPILSLSFKGASGTLVLGKTTTTTRLLPFFSNLLPEGYLRDYLARKLEINSKREFFLLAALGLDLPGAVVAAPMEELLFNDKESSNERILDDSSLRFSLAGVQLKFSAITKANGTFTIPANGAGGSWIIKLPSERHLQVPEAEYSMLKLAQIAGIEVPEFKLIPSSSINGLPDQFQSLIADSLAVKRFDRTTSGDRIHMEDFAQVYGIYPNDKYEKAGYAHIARVLWAEAGEDSYAEFIRRLVFSIAIGNGDMHLKNWSLLYTNPLKPVLSPAYDFVPTIAYIENDSLALNLGGTKNFFDITPSKFTKMAVSAKAPEKLTSKIVEESIEIIFDAWKLNRFDLLLPGKVRKEIDLHMSQLLLFKSQVSERGFRDWLENVSISSVDYEPFTQKNTMILEAPTGRTTVVSAPQRMEIDLIKAEIKTAALPELAEGPIRIFVDEKLYREWRRINFITIESRPTKIIRKDFTEWQGRIETLQGEYSPDTWPKIVSAHQRQSMEEFDIPQSDGSIINFKARVQKISNIRRVDKTGITEAAVELLIQNENTLLDPNEGISYLLSDFRLDELQEAVEQTLREDKWENSFFSEPKKIVAKKLLKMPNQKKKKSTTIPLEVQIIFQDDERKTDLLIKVRDVDYLLGTSVNKEARKLRQSILDKLPVEPPWED